MHEYLKRVVCESNYDIILYFFLTFKPVLHRDMKNLLFTTAMDVDASEGKKYEEPPSLGKFEEMTQTIMDEYDSTHKSKLNIVLFK